MIPPARIVNLVLILIGALFCVASIGLGIGRPNSPGPGLLPFVVGVILILISVGVILEERDAKATENRAPVFKGKRSVVAMSVVASLFAYSLLLDILGFPLTTFFLLVFLFRVSEKQRWSVVLGASLLITVISYLFFSYLLDVALPVGFLG